MEDAFWGVVVSLIITCVALFFNGYVMGLRKGRKERDMDAADAFAEGMMNGIEWAKKEHARKLAQDGEG